METIVEALKALADPTRLRLMRALQSAPEGACVCELVEALALPQYHVSRHLALLKSAGWLESERRGTWVYYRLVPGLAPWRRVQLKAIEQLEDPVFARDHKRLRQRLALRRAGLCVVGYEHETSKGG